MRSAWLRADTMLVRLLAVIAGIACVLAVVACGSDDDTGNSESSGDGTSAVADDEYYPHSVDTMYDTVSIEQAPKRVVAMSTAMGEMLVSLGIEPIGLFRIGSA